MLIIGNALSRRVSQHKKNSAGPRMHYCKGSLRRLNGRDDAEAELKPLAEKIWNYTDDRRFTINELFRQNAVCELKIYQVVSEMLRIGQIATVHPIAQPQPQSEPQLARAS
jgi:hypothetical protein